MDGGHEGVKDSTSGRLLCRSEKAAVWIREQLWWQMDPLPSSTVPENQESQFLFFDGSRGATGPIEWSMCAWEVKGESV